MILEHEKIDADEEVKLIGHNWRLVVGYLQAQSDLVLEQAVRAARCRLTVRDVCDIHSAATKDILHSVVEDYFVSKKIDRIEGGD